MNTKGSSNNTQVGKDKSSKKYCRSELLFCGDLAKDQLNKKKYAYIEQREEMLQQKRNQLKSKKQQKMHKDIEKEQNQKKIKQIRKLLQDKDYRYFLAIQLPEEKREKLRELEENRMKTLRQLKGEQMEHKEELRSQMEHKEELNKRQKKLKYQKMELQIQAKAIDRKRKQIKDEDELFKLECETQRNSFKKQIVQSQLKQIASQIKDEEMKLKKYFAEQSIVEKHLKEKLRLQDKAIEQLILSHWKRILEQAEKRDQQLSYYIKVIEEEIISLKDVVEVKVDTRLIKTMSDVVKKRYYS